MKKIVIILFFLSFYFAYAKTKISVDIPPLQFIIEKIAKTHIYTNSLFSEKYLTEYPSKSHLRKISYARVYLTLNLPREQSYIKDLKVISNIKIIDVSKGITKINNNPYIWMDPLKFRKITLNVYNEIIKLDKENKKLYKKNLDNFLKSIDKIFLLIKQQMFGLNSYNIYAFGDYWDYYAARFGINLYKKKNEKLNAKQIAETIEFTRKNNVWYFLVAPEYSPKVINFFIENSESKPLQNNIFKKDWQANIFIFAQALKDMYK
ncbi:metal ABC transporter solute-binding protein, Zn/Mn family [Arcobacter sp. CECT 8985]|uniref:metal ABC transporter solute-binding protein, Zn/Mn family n=1 Tax=Arcobacter sp. CECT 8985 TaxID=1935424 RepID=UPI00100B90F6|nr:zinc ABC transporter substrate-binding protein [Arcobacter sp. CECT 8985]RXJ87007.1 hypothetical protein CRU93_06380 [Arcobacter sp. CECT 8985]